MTTSSLGTDGRTTVSPIWGTFKRPRLEAKPLVLYAAGVSGAAAAVVTTLVVLGYRVGSPFAVAVIAGIAVYGESQTVRISPAIEVSVGPVLVVLAAVLFGPIAAILVGVTGLLADLRRTDGDQPHLRWLIWTASRALTAACAGIGAQAAGAAGRQTIGGVLVAAIAAAGAELLADTVLAPLPAVIRGTGTWIGLTRVFVPMQVSALPVNLGLISLLAYVYKQVSPWSCLLFVVPAVAAQRLFLLYQHQRETAEQLRVANSRLGNANLAFATALVATLEARDRYTAGHSAAVGIYARDIASRLGLSDEEQRKAHLCGLVHDIGKVGLPAGLLEKSGALTRDERRQMELHPVIGQRILEKIEGYQEIARIVRHHHERVDGGGYPDGLDGQAIPLISRILSVADAYNAMTSDRPYRGALPTEVARLRLASAVGSQFDVSVVAAFEAILATAADEYRVGTRHDFALEAQQKPALVALVGVA